MQLLWFYDLWTGQPLPLTDVSTEDCWTGAYSKLNAHHLVEESDRLQGVALDFFRAGLHGDAGQRATVEQLFAHPFLTTVVDRACDRQLAKEAAARAAGSTLQAAHCRLQQPEHAGSSSVHV